jgi:AAA+ ATPase superfamily predicted ATPase
VAKSSISLSIVGRAREQARLAEILASPEAELVAVYGRRRVGKTHLIREYGQPRAGTYFAVTGEHTGSLRSQLHHFRLELQRVFYGSAPLPELGSWRMALDLLAEAVRRRAKERPGEAIVLFFDEVPWLSTPRSGFVPALDHVWNMRLQSIRQVRLFVCGSAASWMLDKLVHAKGGLYNRITQRIALDPFTLAEASAFLRSRGIRWKPRQVTDAYMALGGIPHYLKQLPKGATPVEAIGRACFDRNGVLFDEFPKLFASLFRDSELHEQIIRSLARTRSGLTRGEILERTRVSSGGRFATHLAELEHAGFVASFTPFGHRAKETSYRLIDEYCMFYLQWVERAPRGVFAKDGSQYWRTKAAGAPFATWAGFAFESVCLRHVPEIIAALGLEGAVTAPATWRYVPVSGSPDRGAQIDLLLDRTDRAITLCEIKYSDAPFRITRSYAEDLKRKLDVFEQRTKTRKQILLALVTPHGLESNTWSKDLIDAVVTLDAFF